MKRILFLMISVAIYGCNGNRIPDAPKQSQSEAVEEQLMEVSFIYGSEKKEPAVIVFYTEDVDSLWMNKEWVKAVRIKMKNLSSDYSTVLLFNSEKHTPDVTKVGMNYPQRYDKYMVCGFWKFPNGSNKFCYGGQKPDGNFRVCE